MGQDGVVGNDGQPYRTRTSAIGASVNSPPLFVGGSVNMGYATMGSVTGKAVYQAYLNKKTGSNSTIFAATNEGMVHVLNSGKSVSGGGREVAAYMPKGAMEHQIDLADVGFRFKYVLDGPLAEDDIYDNTNGKWRQVVTGTGGRGGKYAYAIDSPLNPNGNRTPNASNFLWDIRNTDAGYADMGYITNLSTAGQLQDGTWVTLMNSGHYAGTGKVGLYVVNALTGQLKHFIQIPSSYANNNRGLGGVVAVRDASRKIVAAYAGDANGNVWRFDLRNNMQTPRLSYGAPLFTADSKQAIYAAPAWQVHPEGGVIVNVATGILLEDDDITQLDRDNAIYGLWDPTEVGADDASFSTIQKSDLHQRTLEAIVSTPGNPDPNTDAQGNTYYRVSSGEISWLRPDGATVDRRGWYLKLGTIPADGVGHGGERVIGDLHYMGSSLLVSSVFIRNQANASLESCETSSLANMLYVLDAVTGKPTRFFKKYKASVVFMVGGGFTRGLATAKTSGEAEIGNQNKNEGYVDLKAKKCSPGDFAIIGTGGIAQGKVVCASSWARSWRNIINTPFNT